MSPTWSRRARERLEELRNVHSFVHAEGSTLLSRGTGVEWWTFAGTRANACLADELSRLLHGRVESDALTVTVGGEGLPTVEAAVRAVGLLDPSSLSPSVD
jgi:ATP-dependent helicase Lhr and Lhr-like helicase